MQAAEPAGEGLLQHLEPNLGVGQVAVEMAPPGTTGVAYHRQTQDLSIFDKFLDNKYFSPQSLVVTGCHEPVPACCSIRSVRRPTA